MNVGYQARGIKKEDTDRQDKVLARLSRYNSKSPEQL